jgi:cation diffusion facilitator CzcD-associated flavoprotein CzcO
LSASLLADVSELQTPSREEDVDYVLLGAGMSGIFMLAEALQQGFKSVVVIDRKDR